MESDLPAEQLYYESDAFWRAGMLDDELNTARICTTIQMIPSDVKTLLDVGCGNGVFVRGVAEQRSDVTATATDRSEAAIRYVQSENKYVSEITDLRLRGATYDCVTCLQVLEHIPHPKYPTALSQLAQAARKYLLVSVPYQESIEANQTVCPKCKSQFNVDLHFRSYCDGDLADLFGTSFKMIDRRIVVESKRSYAIVWAQKLKNTFYKPAPRKFSSPVCPVCSYVNVEFCTNVSPQVSETGSRRSFKSSLKAAAVRMLPTKTIPGYWVIALYERS